MLDGPSYLRRNALNEVRVGLFGKSAAKLKSLALRMRRPAPAISEFPLSALGSPGGYYPRVPGVKNVHQDTKQVQGRPIESARPVDSLLPVPVD